MLLAWVFHRWPWLRGVLRMVHRVRVNIIPLWPWGTTSLGAVDGSGTYVRTPSRRCSMCLIEWSVRRSDDVRRSEVEMGFSKGTDRCATMDCMAESVCWRVRRSSAANWGDREMWEEAGVCSPVACWRRVTAATVGLGGRAWKVQDSSCDAPAVVRASFWSFEGLEFGRKRLGCQTWSGVLRRDGRWLRQHFQELGVSSAGVCWTLLWFGVLGVELVFNSVAGFSGGVSCPSEVRVFTVLWEQGEAVLFSGADLFSLSLPFRLTASQADSGSSSFSHWFSWDHFSQCRPGERWRPRGPSHRSYLCSGRVSACESRSLLDGVHSILCVVA